MRKLLKTNRAKPHRVRESRFRAEPHFEAGVLEEPLLLFGGWHRHADPKTGLALYGPYSGTDQERPPVSSITVAVVSTAALASDIRNWLVRCQHQVLNDGTQPFLYPHFPGFSEDTVFQCRVVLGETWQEIIPQQAVDRALKISDYYERLNAVISLYVERVRNLSERTPAPDVVLCGIPDDVVELCTVEITQAGKPRRLRLTPGERLSKRARDRGQLFLMPSVFPSLGIEDEDSTAHHNLRRALKAEAMPFGLPTQLLLSRTVRTILQGLPGQRSVQDPATRAWNLMTALYYKAGGHPWRLAEVRPGTCYIGVSFYSERLRQQPQMSTSLAQVFTHTGDGLVLRGRPFDWDEQGRSPHLSQDLAVELLSDALQLYERHVGDTPRRVVVHKSSRYREEELAGFREALDGVPDWDLVTLGKRRIQFLRQGTYPPLRGTWVRFADDEFLLYTRGYVPYLRTYPGMRAPQPLEVLEHHGTTPSHQILKEILALTKMNWNTADFSCDEPITLAFARRVGDILAEVPPHISPQPEYRFYM